MGYYENELIYNIAKKLDLNYFDYQQMISDVNNGKGDEWHDMVKDLSENTVADFKRLVKKYGGT